MKEITIQKTNAGGRLDKYLFLFLDKAPRSFVYKMLRKKNIILNDKKAQGNEILKEGDRISLYLADETIAKFQDAKDPASETRVSGQRLKKLIAYEDEMILAMNKPSGMLSQRAAPGDVSLNDLLTAYLRGTVDAAFTPGIANRLDRNTTGLVLAGKNLAASREISEAIKDRRIEKTYLCLVKGVVSGSHRIDGYLVKDEKTNTVTVFSEKPEGTEKISGKENAARIQTGYRAVCEADQVTLLEVDLITGKSHQIRAHLASIGHPILGDGKYGDPKINKELKEKCGLNRQLLHAHRVVFHGMKGELEYLNEKEIKAPLPEDFRKICGMYDPEMITGIEN